MDMDKSIEAIWQRGFIDQAELSALKINDLYNRKSQNIVDKMQQMFAINIKGIVIGALIYLAILTALGTPFLGLFVCLLLAPIVIIAKRELKNSLNLSKGESSYEYLTAFKLWLDNSFEVYGNYYKAFYPLFFLATVIQGLVTETGVELTAKLVQSYPTELTFFAVPYYILVPIAVISLLLWRFAKAIYLWDLNLIYGRKIKKLNELIADMEALRN